MTLHAEISVTVNGASRALGDRQLGALLRSLGYDTARPGIAVAVNGAVVRRTAWDSHLLRPGDSIDVVGAVQGG